MKKYMLMMCVVLCVAVSWGQSPDGKKHKSPEEKANKVSGELATQLGLSMDQKQLVYDAVLTKATQMKAKKEALRESGVLKEEMKEAMKSERKAIREEMAKTMKSILTPEQFEKWKALRKERRQEHQQKKKQVSHED